jgi:hypothetical protein
MKTEKIGTALRAARSAQAIRHDEWNRTRRQDHDAALTTHGAHVQGNEGSNHDERTQSELE